jgi:hypothetical protein
MVGGRRKEESMKATFLLRRGVRKGLLLVVVIPASLCAVPQISFAGFCATQTDPSIVYCEDFSGPNPLANYNVSNPWSVYAPEAVPFTSISVIDQKLAWVNNPSGLAWAIVDSKTPITIRDTLLEADVQLQTDTASLRSFVGIQFYANDNTTIRWALQLDELSALLDLNVPGLPFMRERIFFPH